MEEEETAMSKLAHFAFILAKCAGRWLSSREKNETRRMNHGKC
jgi:hypothetical protein